MAEVVLVVDNKAQIMLANRRFAEIVETPPDQLQGTPLDQLDWQLNGQRSLSSLLEVVTSPSYDDVPTVNLRGADKKIRVFKPNASRILDEEGMCRGFLLCLDDITLIEEKNAQLRYLATRDPMTGCYNRRSFFEQFETLWKSSGRYGHPLSCLMVDVDHFKSINDRFGHGVGDDVLKGVAGALLATSRDTDFVCRYGGEEFCILLPHVDIAGAKLAGERFRLAIAALEFPNLNVTASIGCADRSSGAEKEGVMLEQADQALYHAKRNGRNQVVRFDQVGKPTEELAILEQVHQLQKVVSIVKQPDEPSGKLDSKTEHMRG
jgi:diguanylate cyclase (GGDEF)-like protein